MNTERYEERERERDFCWSEKKKLKCSLPHLLLLFNLWAFLSFPVIIQNLVFSLVSNSSVFLLILSCLCTCLILQKKYWTCVYYHIYDFHVRRYFFRVHIFLFHLFFTKKYSDKLDHLTSGCRLSFTKIVFWRKIIMSVPLFYAHKTYNNKNNHCYKEKQACVQ